MRRSQDKRRGCVPNSTISFQHTHSLETRTEFLNAAQMGVISFSTCPVPQALHGAVRELWVLEDDGGLSAGLPKPYIELVISLSGVHWWRAARDAREHCYIDSWVTPIQRGPRYARATGCRKLIGARLEPWAAVRLFGPMPSGDGEPPPKLAHFIGSEARDLRSYLLGASDNLDRFARFTTWLVGQSALRSVASDKIDKQGRYASVTILAKSLGITPRSLRRRFCLDAGLSPKNWLKLHRLDAVLRDFVLANAQHSLADFAVEHGYADQAHLSRDIANFTGATPSEIRQRPQQSPPHYLRRS